MENELDNIGKAAEEIRILAEQSMFATEEEVNAIIEKIKEVSKKYGFETNFS